MSRIVNRGSQIAVDPELEDELLQLVRKGEFAEAGDKAAQINNWAMAAAFYEHGGALLKAADTDAPYERIKATKACLLLAENLSAQNANDAAKSIYEHLAETRTGEDEAYVRNAAKAAMAR